ncbi:MAG TPA: hypothetical protein VH372_11735, partial [Actinospica sp.]|nr:hypothetical protein [Actinospica sp.]
MADPSMNPANPSPFDRDTAYLNQTLKHERMELALDDSVSLQTLGLIIVRAWLAAIIPLVVFGILGAIMLFGAADSGGDISGASLMLSLALFCSGAAFWLVLLLSKITEPIGEWRVLLTERWQYAESYHRMIAAALYQRAIPIELRHRRVKLNTLGQPIKHTIVLCEGDYQAYVTVFPYGTSLYLGWQMWRRRSGAQLIGRALVDRFTAGNIVTAMLRTDRPRAMREAVHLACREAVYKQLTQDRWNLALQVDVGELVEENELLMPHQPPSPVLPPPAQPPTPAPAPMPGPAPAPMPGPAPAPTPAQRGPAAQEPGLQAPAPISEPEHSADRTPAAAPPSATPTATSSAPPSATPSAESYGQASPDPVPAEQAVPADQASSDPPSETVPAQSVPAQSVPAPSETVPAPSPAAHRTP